MSLRCRICGGAVRKGSGSMVYAALEPGELTRVRACVGCAKRAIVLSFPTAPAPEKPTLDAEERDIREVLRRLARHLRGLAKATTIRRDKSLPSTPTFDTFAAAALSLEQAADIADAWAARPEARR